MKEFLVYTGLRLALFVGSFAIVLGAWAALSDQVPVFWVVLIAFVVSGIGSFFLLNPQREAFARRVEDRARSASSKLEEMKAKEDAEGAASDPRPGGDSAS